MKQRITTPEWKRMERYVAAVRKGDARLRRVTRRLEAANKRALQGTYSRRAASRRKAASLGEKFQSPLYELLRSAPGFAKSVEAGKKYLSGLTLSPVKPPRVPKFRPPAPTAHPTLEFLFPPYYDGWTWKATGSSGGETAQADSSGGTMSVSVGDGGSFDAAAALVIAFQPSFYANPVVRISPLVQYTDKWLDFSFNGYTAHNDGYLRISVSSTDLQGRDLQDEQQREMQLWSDGTGWTESHGSNGDGTEVSGTLFPADSTFVITASDERRYLITISCETSCDDSSGLFGGSLAYAQLAVRVPWVTIEQWQV
jgi:hypothetical protein